jgi:hypothetical protein
MAVSTNKGSFKDFGSALKAGATQSVAPSKPAAKTGEAVGSAVGGGVLRTAPGGGTYVDKSTTPTQALTQARISKGGGGGGAGPIAPTDAAAPQINVQAAADTSTIKTNKIPTINEVAKQNILLSQQMKRQDTGPAPLSVSRAPGTFERITSRIKNFFGGTGVKGDKPSAPLGTYNVAGQISPNLSGRGTVLDPRSTGVTTALDVKKQELGLKEVPIFAITEGEKNKVVNEATANIKQKDIEFQQRINSGEDFSKIKKERDQYINSINKQTNENLKSNLEANPEYQKAVKDYSETAKKLGGKQLGTGEIVFPALQERTKEKLLDVQYSKDKKTIGFTDKGTKVLTEAVYFTPLGGPVALATAETEGIYNPKTGQITNQLTTSGNIQFVGGVLATVAGAGFAVRAATKGFQEANALSKLNQNIKSGAYKPTANEIKSGIVKFENVELKVGSKQLKDLDNKIKLRDKYSRELGLGKNVKLETIGSIQESTAIKNAISESSPELASSQGIDVSRYTVTRPSGRVEQGFIVKGIKQTEEGGKTFGAVFKLTKEGKIIKPTFFVEDLKTGKLFIGEKVFKSKLPKSTLVPVEGEPPIEIFPLDRLKVKPYQTITEQKVNVFEEPGKISRIIQKKSIVYDAYAPAKGTKSFQELYNIPESPMAFKTIKEPAPISRSSSVRIETLGPETDLIIKGNILKENKVLNLEKSGLGEFDITNIPEPRIRKFSDLKGKIPEEELDFYYERAKAFSARTDETSLREVGDVFINEKLKLSAKDVQHELVHYYDEELGLARVKLSDQQLKELARKGANSLEEIGIYQKDMYKNIYDLAKEELAIKGKIVKKTKKIPITKKIGTQRTGVVKELGYTEPSKKPIEFEKEFSKGYKQLPEPIEFTIKPEKIKSTSNLFKNKVDEIEKDYPSMVGGKGKVSQYQYPNQQGQGFEEAQAFKQVSTVSIVDTTLAFKTPSIPKLGISESKQRLASLSPELKKKIQTGNFDYKDKKLNVELKGLLSLKDLDKVTDTFTVSTDTKSGSSQISFPALRQDIGLVPGLELEIPKLAIPKAPKIPKIPGPKIPKINLDFGFEPFGVPLRPLPQGSKETKAAKKKRRKAQAGYTSSYAAAAFQSAPLKVSKKEYERLSKKVFSGLEARPVLEIVPEKKAKSKGKKISKVDFGF